MVAVITCLAVSTKPSLFIINPLPRITEGLLLFFSANPTATIDSFIVLFKSYEVHALIRSTG